MSTARPFRLDLEFLDDRLLPSATVLDLTTQGTEATAPSGAIVEQLDLHGGTGGLDPFVRIQGKNSGHGKHAGAGKGIEQGYNTDARPLQFDEKKNAKFTHSITLGQVPVVTINGVDYREFLLGINQKGSSPHLSLDAVRIYLGNAGNLTGYDTTTTPNTLAGLSPVFDLDSGGDVSVLLNARLSSGNGGSDMALFVPNAAFAGADPASYLYLYSMMGALPGAGANGGFEEWALPATQPQTSLSGAVYSNAVGTPLPSVTILLQGTDSQNNPVNLTTTTDSTGAFHFDNLAAGKYTIIQVVPPLYVEISQSLGTVKGTADGVSDQTNTRFTTIQLGSGQNGIDYFFVDNANG